MESLQEQTEQYENEIGQLKNKVLKLESNNPSEIVNELELQLKSREEYWNKHYIDLEIKYSKE